MNVENVPNNRKPDSQEEVDYPVYMVESAENDFWHVCDTVDEAREVATLYENFTWWLSDEDVIWRPHDLSIFKIEEYNDFRFLDDWPDAGQHPKSFEEWKVGKKWDYFVENVWEGGKRDYEISDP